MSSVDEKLETLTEKLDGFVTSIKLNHVLIFFFLHGFAIGCGTTGYIEGIDVSEESLGFIIYLMGMLTIATASRFKLTINFIVKSVLIIYVGLALQWQIMAVLDPSIDFRPFITNVMGGAMYIIFIAGSLIFCFVASND